MRFFLIFTALIVSLSAYSAKKAPAPAKKLKVVTTLSVLASLTRELGAQHVEVASLTTASEDPHFVKAKPTFKRLVSEANLFVQIGRSLELWVPLVIQSSGNAKLISHQILVTASEGISALEVPKALTRAQGDIHPQGNPHVWLSPKAVLKIADNIKNALIKADTAHKADYENNYKNFKDKLTSAMFGSDLVNKAKNNDLLWRLHEGDRLKKYIADRKLNLGGWLKQAQDINYSFFTYHTVFSYMADDFNLKIVGQLEEKSGVQPTLKYQNELIKKAKELGVKHIVAADYYRGNTKLIDHIAQAVGGRKLFVAVDSSSQQSYFDFMNNLISALVKFK